MVLKCKKIYRPVRFRFILLVIAILYIAASGCKVTYSFSGVSISPLIKTISIQYFQNRASLVQPGLSQNLTDALIDKCKAQTGRSLTNGMGDVNFEGEITEYNTKPITVAAGERAAMNRFTITVKVKYTNSVNPELSYEKTFTRYEDYDSNLNLSNMEKELTDKIIVLIVEDIFNAAFVNW